MKITDEKLYELCRLYGEQSLVARRKFAGLLPEVFKRRLYEKKGFGSIYEFAAKLAGMSGEQVQLVLNLEERFVDKPILKSLLEQGEVSVNKLARVASVATSENQLFWAVKAKILPQSALETLVRDEKHAPEAGLEPQNKNNATGVEVQNGLLKPQNDQKYMRAHANLQQNLQNATGEIFGTSPGKSPAVLNLSPEVQQKLLELQQKGIDINSLLLKFLDERELKIAQEKEKLSAQAQPTRSRYIRASTRKLLKQEFGEKCSIGGCSKPAQVIHHTQRYSLARTHNPKYLAPLCENRHKIAHSIDVKFHEKSAGRAMEKSTPSPVTRILRPLALAAALSAPACKESDAAPAKPKPLIVQHQAATQQAAGNVWDPKFYLPMNQLGKIPGIDVKRTQTDLGETGGGVAACF